MNNITSQSTIKATAAEYLSSAYAIKNRAEELKELQKSQNIQGNHATQSEQKKLEERITVLNAEYSHMLHIANYLERYYEERPNPSMKAGYSL